MTSYTARYDRDDDGNWLVEIVEEPRIHTWAGSLATARSHIREAAELWLDDDEVEVVDEYPTWVEGPVEKVIPIRRAAEEASAAATQATIDAVRSLTDQGLSRRDIAELLGISHQRVQQLVTDATQRASA